MDKQIKIALAGNPVLTSLLVTGPVLPWRRRKAS